MGIKERPSSVSISRHGTRAACYPLLDLMNHHGQILYLQSLLSDAEMHWDEAAIADEFESKDG